ncbi:alcohol dehydrogenase catalytic domain-containing protein, partial [Streptococcus sobrinus]|uniref:alcohol dehydrogenase catalytic domain-containing protein n=1 Tax=Streptococcus sobrinus TaxID=1310 RepID=UPI000517414A
MKAALVSQYNKNNINLEMTEIPIPQISPDDVLIKARAAGVNPLDNMISRGEVKIIRSLQTTSNAGNEFVGIVEKVGSQVTGFQAGDRV